MFLATKYGNCAGFFGSVCSVCSVGFVGSVCVVEETGFFSSERIGSEGIDSSPDEVEADNESHCARIGKLNRFRGAENNTEGAASRRKALGNSMVVVGMGTCTEDEGQLRQS